MYIIKNKQDNIYYSKIDTSTGIPIIIWTNKINLARKFNSLQKLHTFITDTNNKVNSSESQYIIDLNDINIIEI